MKIKKDFKAQFFKNYFALAICAISFFIPLIPKLLPVLTIIASLLFLMQENPVIVLRQATGNKFILLFISVYLFYLTGMLYSENTFYGWKDLETKLSLLIFPFLLAGLKTNPCKDFKWTLSAFVGGCILSAIILILRACYLFVVKNQNAFFYENLSCYMHPSYLALYYDFAIVILLLGGETIIRLSLSIKIILIISLSITVVLLSSKAGVLGLALVFIISFIILAISLRKAKFVLLLLAVPASIYILLNYFIGQNQNRFKISEKILDANGLDKTSTESSTMRYFVWKTSLKIIETHPVFGCGTGDVKDELVSAYSEEGISGALAKRLNAHNQFFQTAIALGLAGFLFLAAALMVPLFRSLFFKNWIYGVFLMLIIFNFLFESMLERQDGVMFYAFFNALLFCQMENKKSDAHYH